VHRTPAYLFFNGDISTHVARLRGLQQLMMDMFDAPDKLHELLAFMRDGVLATHDEAEAAGDWTLSSTHNQEEVYCEGMTPPKPNTPCTRKDIWGYFAAQEYTLISPEMHDEFLFQYQLPIMEKFGRVAYGCCEDLGEKIDMLRQLSNLRVIAVTPVADVKRCAEQIGPDYVCSWRPSPADTICCGFDENRIRRIIREGLEAFRANDCRVHINLKDISTLEGDLMRLPRWTKIVRETIEEVWRD
jgi:hypothetical protein